MNMNLSPLVRIVDDDRMLRESLAFMLKQEGFTCATYGSAQEFLTGDAPSRPGCLILDVRMDKISGLQLQEEMIRRGMKLPIIFYSAHGDIDMAVETMQKGAVAFVRKAAERKKLIDAIRLALGPVSNATSPAEEVARWNELTSREKEVAQLIAQGLLNREVGAALGGISFKTVQTHRREIYRKLQVKGSAGITECVLRLERYLKSEE